MFNKFTAGLCFLLFPLMLCIGGCWWAGDGLRHIPPDVIICDKPWVIKVQYEKNPKDWRYTLAQGSKGFVVHFREFSSGDFLAVPMVIEKLDSEISRAYMEARMSPIPCSDNIEYVEYYYDQLSSATGCYNKSSLYKIPVKRGM